MQQTYFGERIAALRKARGLTQEELAQHLGVTNQAVSKWESDQCCPDIMLFPALADLFGVTIDDLFGRTATPAVFPWEDDGNLRAVCFVGQKLVKFSTVPDVGEPVSLEIYGDVKSVISDFSVFVEDGDIVGNVTAGTNVYMEGGDICGNAAAGTDIHMEGGDIMGMATAGSGIYTGD